MHLFWQAKWDTKNYNPTKDRQFTSSTVGEEWNTTNSNRGNTHAYTHNDHPSVFFSNDDSQHSSKFAAALICGLQHAYGCAVIDEKTQTGKFSTTASLGVGKRESNNGKTCAFGGTSSYGMVTDKCSTELSWSCSWSWSWCWNIPILLVSKWTNGARVSTAHI